MRDIANQPGSGISHPKAAMHPVAASKLVTPEPERPVRGVARPLVEALLLEIRALERLDIKVACLGLRTKLLNGVFSIRAVRNISHPFRLNSG
jgi:hypothetical protein